MSLPVTFVENSKNEKLGKNVAATYASIEATCPSSCKLKNNGCYAQLGFVGIHNARLNAQRSSYTPTEIAELEAKLIESSFGGKSIPGTFLRLHVSGDVKTKTGVKKLAAASLNYEKRGGGKVWTYSHAWRDLPKELWGQISVLASCDSLNEARMALKRGYAPSMAVPKFKDKKAYMIGGIKFVPCPAQTMDISCSDCKLCMRGDFLAKNKTGILFEAHGAAKSKIKLRVISK